MHFPENLLARGRAVLARRRQSLRALVVVPAAILTLGIGMAAPRKPAVGTTHPAAPKPAATAVAEAATPSLPALRMVSAPNSNFRPAASRKVDTVVIHYMSGINVDPSHWDSPQLAQRILKENRVSAHYLIDRDGTVYKLVNENNVAWHAGGSIMPAPDNRRNVNSFSIGIENIATDDSGFTDAQYRSLAALIQNIETRHNIRHILGHDQIAGNRAVQLGLRRDQKPDPGAKFDWSRLHSLLQDNAQ